MTSQRKRERVWALIVKEREEREREAVADAALREGALAAIRQLTEPPPEWLDSPEDYDGWFARLKSARRKEGRPRC